MSKIKIKRGTTQPTDGTDLEEAELGYDTVDKRVYVGTGSGPSDAPLPISVKIVRLI